MLKIDSIRGNNIYLIGDEKLDPKEECMSLVKGDSRLFVRKTSIEGLYQYGSEQLCEKYMGHKKGYIWASRASVMNKVFDLALTEAYYKSEGSYSYQCCAIDLVRYEGLLNEAGYEFIREPIEDTEWDRHFGIRKLSDFSTSEEVKQ